MGKMSKKHQTKRPDLMHSDVWYDPVTSQLMRGPGTATRAHLAVTSLGGGVNLGRHARVDTSQ